MDKEHLKKKGPTKKVPLKKSSARRIEEKDKNYYNLIGLTIIILLGVIIYSNSFNNSFHFDDFYTIVDNLKIRNLLDFKTWWNFSPNRPVAFFTFALNYHFNQLDVHYWHLVNLTIHLINTCLIWWLTQLFFSLPSLKDHEIARHKKMLAFFTALLFVSHPLATQSVNYIVQRMTSMVAMFYLLSIVFYIKARLSGKGNVSKYLLFAGSFLSAVLAMLTKENAFTLPFAILLIEIYFFQAGLSKISLKEHKIIKLLPALLIIVSFACLLFLKVGTGVFNPLPPSEKHLLTLTPYNYLLTQFNVIVTYLKLLILPINQNLDYDYPISDSIFDIRTLLSLTFLLTLVVLAVYLFKKQQIISFGIFWFFLTLAVESSIIPLDDVIFEHRTYLPSFGFFLIISTTLCVLFWDKNKYIILVIFVIIIGSNSLLSIERNKVWKDELTLWSDNIVKTPNKARPINNLGFAYTKLGQYDKAIIAYSKAIELSANFKDPYFNSGFAYEKLGQLDKAIAYYSKAIKIDPNYRDAYFNQGVVFGNLGQWENAIKDYTKAIEFYPVYTQAYVNRGIAYGKLGQFDKAITDFSKAIDISPSFGDSYFNRGTAYGNLRQWDKAIADYTSVLAIAPNYADAYYYRGITYGNIGQWEKAIIDYSRTISINPKNAIVYYRRGAALNEIKEWNKAITDYSSAISSNPKFKEAYVNRGTTYANLGQWDKALDDFDSALRIDPNFSIAISNREIAYKNLKASKSQ